MKITYTTNHYFHTLTIENGDTIIKEDITSFTVPHEIQIGIIENFINVLDSMLYHSENKIDGSELIVSLFEKLPLQVAKKLIAQLQENYGEDI
jgi:hypothetical protein